MIYFRQYDLTNEPLTYINLTLTFSDNNNLLNVEQGSHALNLSKFEVAGI